jgi:microcystin-dependent protein
MANPFLAEIRMFAGNFAPRGWVFTNGQILSIQQNTAVFSLLGTNYGGNGTTNFALPNLQGMLPMGTGQGPGLSPRSVGEVVGVETVTLTVNELAAHSHTPGAFNGPADQPSPAGNIWAMEPVGATNPYSGAAPNVPMAANLLLPTGGGQPHSNLMPHAVVSFIIALAGIFPARN